MKGSALSPRERQVAIAVAEGQSNKSIAYNLKISERTVKQFIHQIFEKLGVTSRVGICLTLMAPGMLLAQPRLSQSLTPTSTTVILAGGGMNPAALQVNITVPAGATITAGAGLAAAGKALYFFVPPTGPAVLLVAGGVGPIPDGPIATVTFTTAFTPVMSSALAVDAAANLGTILISGGPCDLNQDGVVTLADVQIAIDQATGKDPVCKDLTGDKVCDVREVQRVVNAAAGGVCKIGP